jgi:6-phosphogluconate dehydrogenase
MNAHIAMIGLGVMGRNLALNLAAQGRVVAVFDRDAGRLQAMAGTAGVVTCATPVAAVQALQAPRALLLMVPAGPPVDEAIAMLAPHLAPGDVLLDGGNSHFRDTIRRARDLAARGIHFLGLGISGGETGARLGPSIMAGGAAPAWARVADHFLAIAARHQGAACCAWFGGDGAGHFVKMIHNGIEYAEMQVIAEIYAMLRDLLGLSAYEMAKVFERWNAGELGSYLIEITADILHRRDGANGPPLIDRIVDRARQKGTGQWASVAAMELGAAAPTLAEAVAARHLSAVKPEREALAASLGHKQLRYAGDGPSMIANLADALLGARIAIYAQGFQVIAAARTAFEWPELRIADVARVWQGGCIIRAHLLDDIRSGFAAVPDANLLQVPAMGATLQRVEPGWRRAIAAAVGHSVAIPALASALSWTDGMRTARSGANLIQAQRDYFGTHGLERTDQPGDVHIDWSAKP